VLALQVALGSNFEHGTQALPPVPQFEAAVPVWQYLPVPELLQQPVQVLVGQVPPQPSDFGVQLATHAFWMQNIDDAAQSMHDTPPVPQLLLAVPL